MSLIIHGVVVDRKNDAVYEDLYINYAAEEIMVTKRESGGTVQTGLAEVPCFGPGCNHTILMTTQQKGDLLLSFDEKYNKTVLPTCGKSCTEKLLKMYRDSSAAAAKN